MANVKPGDKVVTSTGMEGKVTFTESGTGRVAVKATSDGVGHSKGDEKVFHQTEVRKQ